MGGEPSRQGHMYSFGILVLEMFAGRSPTDEMFKDGFNLYNFVKMALPERLEQIIDSALIPGEVEETVARRVKNNYKSGEIEIDIEERNISFEDKSRISTNLRKCLVPVLRIGLACSKDSPNDRMNIGDVTRELEHIRNVYMDTGIHRQRQRTD